MLSLESMLRLIHSTTIRWTPALHRLAVGEMHDSKSLSSRTRLPSSRVMTENVQSSSTLLSVDAATGAWGRSGFALRVRAKAAASNASEILKIIRDRRTEWDALCARFEVVDQQKENKEPFSRTDVHPVAWDIVRFHARPPRGARLLRCLCLCRLASREVRK